MNRVKRQRPEQQIQRAVVAHLRLRAKPDVLWWHTPNARKQSLRQGAAWKAEGVLAGVSDLILLYQGRAFALELKSDGGRLSPAQQEFMDRFNTAGGYAGYAVGVDRAIECLKAWQLIK